MEKIKTKFEKIMDGKVGKMAKEMMEEFGFQKKQMRQEIQVALVDREEFMELCLTKAHRKRGALHYEF